MFNVENRLKKLRENAGITQKQLAESLNVTQTAVNYWENGKREPNKEMIEKIADYFKVTPSYLMGWNNDKLTAQLASWGVDAIMAHSKEEKDILKNCKMLNIAGQQKAANYVEDLTKIPEYQKEE